MLKKILVIVFVLFAFNITVNAAEKGVLGEYSYQEVDHKTDFIKFELSNGQILIYQFQSESIGLINRMKEQFASHSFDGVSLEKSTNFFTAKNEKGLTYEVNSQRYKNPVAGDLVAFLESVDSDVSISSFQIYLLPVETPLPVFAHIVYGDTILSTLTNGVIINNIRFVKYELVKEEEPEKNNSGASSGNNNSQNNNNNNNGEVHLIGGENAGTTYCSDPNFIKPFKFLGRIFLILKILIPLVIIVLGIIDLGKAIISSKDDEIKKSVKSLTMRVIAGLIIFFIPTIINLVFMLVDDWNKYSTDYSNCSKCVQNPNNC